MELQVIITCCPSVLAHQTQIMVKRILHQKITTREKSSILAKPKPGYIFSHWEGESIADPLSSSTEVNLEEVIF